MKLSKIIEIVNPILVTNYKEKEIEHLFYDSREVKEGGLFFAIKGESTDGHRYIKDAINRGASSVVMETDAVEFGIPAIKVRSSRRALSKVSAHFFGFPSEKLAIIGITGTNGKTTTAMLLRNILRKAGKKVAVISTVGCFLEDEKTDVANTTPESLWLQKAMRKMVDKGIDICIMEVSSHGIKMGRIEDIDFDFAVFTNISRDHLNFHKTFSDYLNTKLRFFHNLKKEKIAFINVDDVYGEKFVQKATSETYTFGIDERADFEGKVGSVTEDGLELSIIYEDTEFAITSPLRGRYNAYNILPAFALSLKMGIDNNIIKDGISSFKGVEGRGDRIETGLGFECILDYAHTPDALYRLCSAEKEIAKGRLICVFGAGGDRDKGKRKQMGKVASTLCDEIIVTSDNPRGENPRAIIEQIIEGVNSSKVSVEVDRKKAIENSLRIAQKGDTVIVAGKGHETYQEIGGKRFHFSDREVIESCILSLREGNL